ncbi:hypothetical protein BN59_02035 [Legionella massiliensis]|uniref:Uncharacterized protein n=1 Tax=Legionella massiliensis TaxID=1034943 RepID=A0A078KTE0_9GAMM|nr:hypothetical protein [Legionella massiliensis]CDZ77745.1 hypothetical protein BN59_02035 [Legionella massiliensis]CEE13483.1 hypothetical protein BN1094_02035 [Legionella massiliensis]
MPAVRSLTEFYASFFTKTALFAVSPYTLTFAAFLDSRNPKTEELLLGVAACVILSTVVPVLPWITSITFAIAGFAMSVALASMFIAYPVALIMDALEPDTIASPSYTYN